VGEADKDKCKKKNRSLKHHKKEMYITFLNVSSKDNAETARTNALGTKTK
jgi:hypothetical protein